ncbi:MAG: hypothetical protein AB7R89_26010 [Dehalococcoidia bacterium]
MKRWWIFGMAALVAAVGIGGSMAAVRSVSGSDVPTAGQRLDGTWIVTANLDSAPPGVPLTFMALNTFFPDGGFIETNQTTPIRSPVGHGQWVRAGDRLFSATFTFVTFDAQGVQTGIRQVTRSIRLSEDLQTFRAVARNDQFDLEGNLVFSGGATETARRLPINDPPPAP